MSKPLVSICIITFNHESYIKQCIESVLSQIVNFDLEIIISDDNSIDDTSRICENFANLHSDKIVYVKNKKNLGMKGNWISGIKKCNGKYIALIEGDDFWIDSLKIQKQVDFLENNSTFNICWTKYQILENEQLSVPDWLPIIENKERCDFDLSNIFNPYCTYTLTVLFKRSAFLEMVDLAENMEYFKDNSLYCLCLSQGKGAVLNFFGGVYRVHSGGIYSGANEYIQRYSSFLNLNEIIHAVPGCNNQNLVGIRNALLRRCTYLVNEEKVSIAQLQKMAKLYLQIFKYLPFSEKLENLLRIIKQFLLLFKLNFISK